MNECWQKPPIEVQKCKKILKYSDETLEAIPKKISEIMTKKKNNDEIPEEVPT